MLIRRGTSLVELLVALALAAVVLASATVSLLRQQRTAHSVRGAVQDDAQLRAMSMLLPAVLAPLSAVAGDLAAGEASDTALQLRDRVGIALACDSAVGRVALASAAAGAIPLSGLAAPPRVSDSLWWYRSSDSGWVGRRVLSVGGAGACRAPLSGSSAAVGLELDGGDSIPAAVPLVLTRWTRYSLYRSGDGTWQLGMREWSDATNRFAAPQPVAGPFLRGPVAGLRTGFRYFDASGVELGGAGRSADVSRIALVRITGLVAATGRVAADSVRRDSVDVAIANGTP